ncbi:hypothetical protein BN7_2124 [Wickerhamomyces ciferrii]|uniref:Protein kinase domain-containing protein n=1 Tax=Wickerhamomyces ciferrii (strain ATCC 14091 / BCRC 22168 / CBS 111 / JCM 3599 / NBRC 0793 / NRRL Y-1031 F-60-10) TaxID=1206466 RepID=K0KBY7_WICCF|nr:uncharacterized protein BN7_2124 [Wickerhamomyces ciferrii]CCH42580.1 hypothetical protein BN7_2124 [Wickerhamomyces ciferrii]
MTIDNSNIPTTNEVNLTKDINTGEKFLNQYKLLSKLGNGHNGKVYLGLNIENDKYYAIKEISKISKVTILNKNPNNQIKKINNEINIMKLIIKHPKIMKLYEILNDDKFNKIFLILEYCSKGELKFGINHKYSINSIKDIMRDIVLGLEYLNGIGIIHRDIKPSNLLINHDNFIKISDFGISLNKFQINDTSDLKSNENFGTPAFSPPELCNGSNFNKIDSKCDIWSLGITIYCLYYQKLPFNGNNEYELFNEIINNDLKFPENSDPESLVLNDLLLKMLNKNPGKRYSIHDVKSHEFLNSNLDHESKLQFMKFNEYYLFKRESNVSNFAKSSSKNSSSNTTLNKFKSIFTRKSSISKNNNNTSSTSSLPVDNTVEKEVPIQLQPHHQQPTTSSNLQTSSNSVPNSSTSTKESSTPFPPSINQPTKTNPFLLTRPPIKSSNSQIASSTNSLNLNSLLKSKKDVPNYLDDSTFFQSVDSDYSSEDSESNDDDDDKLIYNDVEDTLSIRIGPKRQASSLQVKSVNEYLGL